MYATTTTALTTGATATDEPRVVSPGRGVAACRRPHGSTSPLHPVFVMIASMASGSFAIAIGPNGATRVSVDWFQRGNGDGQSG